MKGFDAWLEKPYTDAAKREADFEAFCEREGLDPEDDASWTRFEGWQEELYDSMEADWADAENDRRKLEGDEDR